MTRAQLTKDSIDLGIVVCDAEKSLAFYQDLLGFEFKGEMDHSASKFKEMGSSVDTWDGDDTDVTNNESPLYKRQEEETGLSNEEVMAANWASMIGQGDSVEDMSPEDYLTDNLYRVTTFSGTPGAPGYLDGDKNTAQFQDIYRIKKYDNNI